MTYFWQQGKEPTPDKHQQLPIANAKLNAENNHTSKFQKSPRWIFGIAVTLFLAQLIFHPFTWPIRWSGTSSGVHKHREACHQVPALLPDKQSNGLLDMDEYIQSDAFRNVSIARLSGAVQIPTESFDDLGPVGEDKRWEIFYDFAAYLEKTFPRVHETLTLETVNTHGLLFTWHGEDANLKPTLLMAHQDVVPVPEDTIDAWTHPPFSGHYDGKLIWGRGASDCKNQLIGILEALEELIKADFTPRRTVLLSFGFDEEISGRNGAGYLAAWIYSRYGHNGVAAVIDEGAGFAKPWGLQVALPGVAEKGYTDVHITVRMPGGHSSIPPDHTGIGVMSEFISLIEANPYRTWLDDQNPYLGLLTCSAEHAPSFPSKLKKLLHERSKHTNICKVKKDRLAIESAKDGPGIKYLMQTSVAADLISGGIKVNALPERTTAIINHRINVGERSFDIHSKITHLAQSIAKKYNLTLHAFDGAKESPRSIMLYAGPNTLEPAPVTPTNTSVCSPWTVLSGTTRALYGEEVVVAPGIMTGNTDTRYYWNVSRHIFRFTAGWDGESSGLGNIHTVDEFVPVKSHVNMVRWMSLFIRNMDQSDLE